MNKNFLIFLSLFFLGLFLFQPELESNESKNILCYSLQKMREVSCYDQIPWLSRFFVEFRYEKLLINCLYNITDDYGGYLIIKELLKSDCLPDSDLEEIKKNLYLVKDNYLKCDLLKGLILFYIKRNNRKKAVLMVQELEKHILSFFKKDQGNKFNFNAVLDLVEPLRRYKIKDKSLKLLSYSESYLKKQIDFQVLEKYLTLIILKNDVKQMGEIINEFRIRIEKINNRILDGDQIYFRFGEILFEFRKFEESCDFIKKGLDYCFQNKLLIPIIQFLNRINRSDLASFLTEREELMDMITNNIIYVSKKPGFEVEYIETLYNKSTINFLIENGKKERALEIVLKFNKDEKDEYEEFYEFCLRMKSINNNYSILLPFLYSEKITNKKYEIELLFELAKRLMSSNNELNEEYYSSLYLNIMERLEELIEIKKEIALDGELIARLSMLWLKGGYPGIALSRATLVDKNRQLRDIIIFEIAQYYILKNNPGEAKSIAKNIDDINYQAKIISKIAAWKMLGGEIEIGEQLFKRAIDIIMKDGDSNIYDILSDYANVKLRKRIEKTYLMRDYIQEREKIIYE